MNAFHGLLLFLFCILLGHRVVKHFRAAVMQPREQERDAMKVEPKSDRLRAHGSSGCGRQIPHGMTLGRISRRHVVKVEDPNHPQGHRRYALFIPTTYNSNIPAPLILDFHGFYDNAPSEAKEDGVSLAAEREGFIIAYPNGLADNPEDPDDWWNQWNGGGTNGTVPGKFGSRTCTEDHSKYPCYQSCIRAGVCKRGQRHDCGCSGCADDLGFVVALLAQLESDLCIDNERVHGTGMSNGALFLYYLATTQEVGTKLASIAPVEGSFLLGFVDTPKVPMPVMDIHGTKDDCIPANVSNSWGKYKRQGCPMKIVGQSGCTVGDDGWFYHPMSEILQKWSIANRCPSGITSKMQGVWTPFDGRTGWSCVLPHGANCDAEIRMCTHNLGHTWPFHEGTHKVRTKEFGEMLWGFMKDKRRVRKDGLVDSDVLVDSVIVL